MKVVLFCGGFGMRLREFSESTPKPMVKIGYRPILWHIMKYYAHFGHKEFILCLGWKADIIKEYFLNYSECMSNDFVLSAGSGDVNLLNSDIHDWSITFVDTGVTANIGERLKAVEPHLKEGEAFLANYTDGLTDLYLPDLIDQFYQKKAVGAFLSVKPTQSFHAARVDKTGIVTDIKPIDESDVWMNGGFFVFDHQIFQYLRDGEELVEQPFQRLIGAKRLCTLRYDGFWSCMDTFKEKQELDDLFETGRAPWIVWGRGARPIGRQSAPREDPPRKYA